MGFVARNIGFIRSAEFALAAGCALTALGLGGDPLLLAIALAAGGMLACAGTLATSLSAAKKSAYCVVIVTFFAAEGALLYWHTHPDSWPFQPSASAPPPESASLAAMAKLTELGWSIKPQTDGIIFEANTTLPPMDKSSAYFAQLNMRFSLHLQMINTLNGLHYISGVGNCCTKIDISAGRILDLSELGNFKRLKFLSISQVPYDSTEGVDLSPLASLTELRELNLDGTRVRDIHFVARMKNLHRLDIGNTLVADLTPVSNLQHLESLELRQSHISDLGPLRHSSELSDLSIDGLQVPSLPSISHLPRLKKLTIIDQQSIDFGPVSSMTQIDSLWIWTGSPLDILPLRGMVQLRQLTLQGGVFLSYAEVYNIEIVANLNKLEELTLGELTISDIGFVSTLRNLTTLNLNMIPITSLEPLRGLIRLKHVALNVTNVIDVSPLLELPSLVTLSAMRTPARADVLTELKQRGVIVTP